MWQLINSTPFRTAGYFARDRNGAEHWIVVLRARFRVLDNGMVRIADQQVPRMSPEYRDASASELRAETDLAPFRPHADVIFAGTACAPNAATVKGCAVKVAVGRLKKEARVSGRRVLRIGSRGRATLDGPEVFAGIRLTWRASLGGLDPFVDAPDHERAHAANPVGRGWTAKWMNLPRDCEIELPFVEDPRATVALATPLPEPHGFGPLQRAWRPRLRYAGTYDEVWKTEQAPLPPADFSEFFHHAAPADQVYEGLRGGEPVSIEGLHANGPYQFRLPQILLDSRTRIGRDTIDHRLRLIGATIDGTEKTVDLVWNGTVPCNGRDHLVKGSAVSVVQMAGVA